MSAIDVIQKVTLHETEWGTFAYYIPIKPQNILVLGHCYPWPDGSRTAIQLAEHVQKYGERWKAFADDHQLILLVPAFGSGDFLEYRDLFGAQIDADIFVNDLVDQYGHTLIASFDGRFYLYGHSAGAQFANRYTVVHPQRLKGVVLSAPGRYPYPDPAIPWPYGMGAIRRTRRSIETSYQPAAQGWEIAATRVPIAIVVGSKDLSICEPQPGHAASTRLDYAQKWLKMMNALAEQNGNPGTVSLTVVEGATHDPVGLTPTAQTLLKIK